MNNKAVIAIALTIALFVLFPSCTKENGIGGNDNVGVEFRMRNKENGNDYIKLLQIDDAIFSSSYTYKSHIRLRISNSNNFYAEGFIGEGDYMMISDIPFWSIVSVGNVTGLGKIKTIPQTGWATEVAVHPGNGYVVRCQGNGENYHDYGHYSHFCRYARVYVEDWIESTSGGVIGAVIHYEDNWR